MEFGLKGKTALVLGGGGGLGRAISIALADEGARIAVADIDNKAVAETEAALAKIDDKAPVKSIGLVWDLSVTSPQSMRMSRRLNANWDRWTFWSILPGAPTDARERAGSGFVDKALSGDGPVGYRHYGPRAARNA